MTTHHRSWFRSLDRECQAAREVISAELDGEVSELEAASARRHLAACADCDRFAGSVVRTAQAVRSAPALVPSRRLVPAPRRVAKRGLVGAGFAASLAAAALLGAGVAGHFARSPAGRQVPRQIIVANNEESLAMQQLVIRQMLHLKSTPASHIGRERLG